MERCGACTCVLAAGDAPMRAACELVRPVASVWFLDFKRALGTCTHADGHLKVFAFYGLGCAQSCVCMLSLRHWYIPKLEVFAHTNAHVDTPLLARTCPCVGDGRCSLHARNAAHAYITHTCNHTNIYSNTHTHTHTHTYIHTCRSPGASDGCCSLPARRAAP